MNTLQFLRARRSGTDRTAEAAISREKAPPRKNVTYNVRNTRRAVV